MPTTPFFYCDYAATTPVDPEVFSVMEPWLRGEFGNPSSPHAIGHRARKAVDDARATVASILHCSPQEVVFTAGGTESDNLAIFGVARAMGHGHIITTAIEHAAVFESCRELAKEGYEVTVVRVEHNGIVDVPRLRSAVKETTIFASVMAANNEIGTIQPIAEAAAAMKAAHPPVIFHTDACQAAGFLPLDVQNLGADLLTLNGSKIYGPKGVGVLYVKRGVPIKPLLYGGDQEYGLRPGTENVAGIVGLAKALELVEQRRKEESQRLLSLRDQCIDGILSRVPDTHLNGDRSKRLPNNVNITIRGVDGESLLFSLDQEGIAASLGSACTTGSLEPSHVLLAIGLSKEDARRSLRLTIGRQTTKANIDRLLDLLPPMVERLRRL